MRKKSGAHFYIDIFNLNEVIADEEEKTGCLKHAIHALDTLFTSVERYAKRECDNLVVEKVTGSRLHLYIVDGAASAFSDAVRIVSYAYHVCNYINHEIGKYKSLIDLVIRAGLAYGDFYEFTFTVEDYSELTTIGYAANISAKLQALADPTKMAITEDVYMEIDAQWRDAFECIHSASLAKYEQTCFYLASIWALAEKTGGLENTFDDVKEYANKVNLTDLSFNSANGKASLDKITRTQGMRIRGIVVLSDIRDFTSQFAADDDNLEEMAEATQGILERMYQITKKRGIHVQFQGDREFAIYQDYEENERGDGCRCFEAAVFSAMRMIDAVGPFGVSIGVGQAYGTMHAAKIGARGEKDYLILGEKVSEADAMEDRQAGKNEIAITEAVYNGLKLDAPDVARLFIHREGCYYTTVGYDEYRHKVEADRLRKSTARNEYNGAWGPDA